MSDRIGAEYFAVEDEESDATSDDDEPSLSWRGDPETTHSDWTIIVSCDNKETVYHVHKNILAAGAHSCKYFSALFSTNMAEQQDSTSRITLGKEEASVFPIMLDFVYSNNDTLDDATMNNAVILRSLARYFRCKALTKRINEFIQENLTVDTAVAYLRKAFDAKDEKLEESARKLIVENYEDVPGPFFLSLPLVLIRSIISSPNLPDRFHSFASADLYSYFKANPKALNACLLNELTGTLSEVSVYAAEGFMTLIGQLDPTNEDEQSWLALDRLLKLCTEAVGVKWKELDTEQCMRDFKSPVAAGDYHGSGRLAISHLSSALDRAKVEFNAQSLEIEQLKSENADQKSRIAALETRNAELEPPARSGKRKRSPVHQELRLRFPSSRYDSYAVPRRPRQQSFRIAARRPNNAPREEPNQARESDSDSDDSSSSDESSDSDVTVE